MTKSKFVVGMGFRDLALFNDSFFFFLVGFNDSLLAKQAWCLLHNKFSFLQGVQSPVFS